MVYLLPVFWQSFKAYSRSILIEPMDSEKTIKSLSKHSKVNFVLAFLLYLKGIFFLIIFDRASLLFRRALINTITGWNLFCHPSPSFYSLFHSIKFLTLSPFYTFNSPSFLVRFHVLTSLSYTKSPSATQDITSNHHTFPSCHSQTINPLRPLYSSSSSLNILVL